MRYFIALILREVLFIKYYDSIDGYGRESGVNISIGDVNPIIMTIPINNNTIGNIDIAEVTTQKDKYHSFLAISLGFISDLDARNHQSIRKLFAEIICVLTLSPKKPSIESPYSLEKSLKLKSILFFSSLRASLSITGILLKKSIFNFSYF